MPAVQRLSWVLAVCALALPAGATAATPIPQLGSFDAFSGAPATPQPLRAPDPPRHPFMAPNGRSNLHNDAFQTDTYQGYGPLGRGGIAHTSASYLSDCASITFDSKGRLVSVCVGVLQITLRLLDPRTLDTLASYELPGRDLTQGNPFTNFTGGGYFYLDNRDRAIVATSERHLLTIAQTEPAGFRVERDVDLNSVVPQSDAIISALPGWDGRIWVASKGGVVATVAADGTVKAIDTREGIGNSFAVDSDGSVSIVTNAALYRFEAGADGTPRAVWREPYENTGVQKPGQSQAGSGTTPTLIGDDFVAITDNADPMNVLVYRRGREVAGARRTCRVAVFGRGASNTDQSLIATPELIVVENNYGYASPVSVELGQTTTPGLEGIRLRRDGSCEKQWRSEEIAPTVVPKLSLAAGLVYTYTKPRRSDGGDPWYFTAIDARTGRTVFKALAGSGLGYNNNYAPVTLGPDGSAYIGVLGGVVRLQDREPLPPLPATTGPRPPRLRIACVRAGARARVTGAAIRDVTVRVGGVRGSRRDPRRPFALALPGRRGARVVVTVRFSDGRRAVRLRAALPRCAHQRRPMLTT
jgi:hypothetical protein